MNKTGGLLLVFGALLVAVAAALGGVGVSSAHKNGCHDESDRSAATDHSARWQQRHCHPPKKHCHRHWDRNHGHKKHCPRVTPMPTVAVTPTPVATPTATPVATPTASPSPSPTLEPTASPTPQPTAEPTPPPTPEPTASPTPEPTAEPTPEPTPAPVPEVDIEVTSFTLNAPNNATAGLPFQLTGQVNVRNNAPTTPGVVDTTFTPSLPPGCSATTGVMTVQNTIVPAGGTVFLSRSWMVTCMLPGLSTFDMNVTSLIDAAMPVVDPNPGNNAGSGSDSTQVN